jgi:glycosyltransferase involved in cell wall biosynthesis
MSAELPLVSIVTPVYNGAQFIEELILSVKNQDYPHVEHIIVDDGSNDGDATVQALRKYPHLCWWSHPNQGQYATMNVGLSAAKGDLVCFVSSDDILLPGAIKAVVEFFLSHPEMDGVFGLTGYMNEQGTSFSPPLLFPSAPFWLVKYFAHVLHCSFYLRRESLMRFDLLFDPSLKYTGDYEWMIRIAKTSLKIGMVKQKLSMIRLHSSQTSQLYVSSGLEEIETVYKKHAVNIVLRRLVLGIHFFYYRFWEMGQKYKTGGISALSEHVGAFFKRLLHV